MLDRLLNFSKKGFYVDVGGYHPVKYNNTYKLYRQGWRGINLDLDSIKIEAFNLRRPGDINITAAVSDAERTVTMGYTGFYTVTQTIDPDTIAKIQRGKHPPQFREIKTRPLTGIIDGTPYKDQLIDVLSVDVEGHELPVLSSLDFARYQPKIIIVESHLRVLEEVMQSELYRFLKDKGYSLCNWMGPSLLFIHPRKR